jgi:uncharacterized membrane protein YdbT with pleckstrin-like domain
MSYPKRLLSSNENIVLSFRPHWQVLISPILMLLLAIGLQALAIRLLSGQGRTTAVVAVAGVALLLVARPLLTWFFTQYAITNERIIYRAGIFARKGKEIPIEAVNDVSFSQSFLERIVKSGDLLIESAGEYGQSRFTDVPRPEDMQALIYQIREDRKVVFGSGGQSVAQQLEALAKLRDQGILSPDEFETQKQKLLAK